MLNNEINSNDNFKPNMMTKSASMFLHSMNGDELKTILTKINNTITLVLPSLFGKGHFPTMLKTNIRHTYYIKIKGQPPGGKL